MGDMAKYKAMPALGGDREATYTSIKAETDKLKGLFGKKPHDLKAEATYLCDTIKRQMACLRRTCTRTPPTRSSSTRTTRKRLVESWSFFPILNPAAVFCD